MQSEHFVVDNDDNDEGKRRERERERKRERFRKVLSTDEILTIL